MVLEEESITNEVLLDCIRKLYDQKDTYVANMNQSSQADSINTVINLIQKVSK